jgi:thiosulfate/3-mercaptopyruvate sulfurtransferase
VAAAAEGLRDSGGSWRGAQLLDTRTPGEFEGSDLRGNARGGRPPGAVNVPHAQMLKPDGTLKSPAELRALFERAGLDLDRRVISYCQLGFRGALGCLALAQAGVEEAKLAVYDASMREWLNDETRAVEAGPALRRRRA